MLANYLVWFNLLALVLAAAGGLILAIYGLPNLKTISSGSYTQIDESTPQIQRARRLSTLGLCLLVAGFVFQAIVQVLEIIFA